LGPGRVQWKHASIFQEHDRLHGDIFATFLALSFEDSLILVA
jgi:hypothetical protein